MAGRNISVITDGRVSGVGNVRLFVNHSDVLINGINLFDLILIAFHACTFNLSSKCSQITGPLM